MKLFLVFAFPLAEIAAFIVVGRTIGVFATLSLVVASSALGIMVLRDAGTLTMARLQQGVGSPRAVLAEGGTRMAAGLLLLIPGFLSDLAAAALLVTGLRRSLSGRGGQSPLSPREPPNIIEGDFRRLEP